MKENGAEKSKIPLKKQVEGLYDLMKEENLEELEINDKDFHVHLKRKGRRSKAAPVVMAPQAVEAAAAQPAAAEPAQNGNGIEGDTLKSPITGVFYRAPGPSSAPFTKEGDTAAQGKTLCIVEAMKVMNEIKADRGMKIVRILVENGKSVTAGQDLFVIEKL